MSQDIAIIQGHPDTSSQRLTRGLATAYAQGARAAGHTVRIIDVAVIEFPLLHSQQMFDADTAPQSIREAQETIRWAQHLAIFYPLWLGTMPALLHAFFEQTFRPGFAAQPGEPGQHWEKLLTGRSAHLVITMSMAAPARRCFFRGSTTRAPERTILDYAGIRPIRETRFGQVEKRSAITHDLWKAAVRELGRQGK